MIFFAAAFGSMMLVSLLLCVKANLVWLRSGFAACAAVCAVGSSLNCLFIEGREIIVVEKAKPVEPTIVAPLNSREIAAAIIAAGRVEPPASFDQTVTDQIIRDYRRNLTEIANARP